MFSPRLETERLILRRIDENDLDVMYELITDERLSKFLIFPNNTKEDELEYIKKLILNYDTDIHEQWMIVRKEDNVPVGHIGVNNVYKKHNYCNVGYTIRFDYWGNGYAAEALKVVTDHLLNDIGHRLVECSCNEKNTQSSRVMIKAGFVKDGYIANRRQNKDGTYSGVEYYSKTK